MNDRQPGFWENILKIGTPECALFCAVAAMGLALLYLGLGFWPMVLVAAAICVGAFIGGVKDKKAWVKKVANRVIPSREMVPYREKDPEITRAVREATGKAPKAEEQTEEEAPVDQE
jgi:uncharacterized membrane protein